MAASSSAEPPKTVMSHMLNRSREVERVTTWSMVRISETGRPVAWRNASWIGPLSE